MVERGGHFLRVADDQGLHDLAHVTKESEHLDTPKTIGFYEASVDGEGGMVRYLKELLGSLDQDRYRPVLFARQPCSWHDELADVGVEVVTLEARTALAGGATCAERPSPEREVRCLRRPRRFDASWGRRVIPPGIAWHFGFWKEVRCLTALFRMVPVAALHLNSVGVDAALLAARAAGINPVVATWHWDASLDEPRRQRWGYRTLEHVCMRSVHAAVAVSHATRQSWVERCCLGRRFRDRISVIHNGIAMNRVTRRRCSAEAKRELGVPAEAVLIGSLGGLLPVKGYDLLVRALAQLLPQFPNLHVIIAGRGPEEEHLKTLAAELGLHAHVHFPGFVAEVARVLEATDVYVQCSVCEAHPIALLEAGAMALPAVVSGVGGMPETVLDGISGAVVRSRSPSEWARVLQPLVADAALRRRMGEAAQERVRGAFSNERMLAETMELYDRLLRPGHQTSAV
jgi:glycosyltransferase involved in cell wall biosynthesis